MGKSTKTKRAYSILVAIVMAFTLFIAAPVYTVYQTITEVQAELPKDRDGKRP
ncbi:MAG: hypothetical protein FWD90_11485 [Defluviitaleaceae bacterium]|nr:hypothetical protein [Defluviitaleaceae bacterium]